LATPNYGFEKRQKELAKKKKKEEKLKMKSELKSGLRVGDPSENVDGEEVEVDAPHDQTANPSGITPA
jgi:hypothetical protein